MQNKKLITLIVLVVIAAASLIYGVTASRSKKRPPETTVVSGEAQQPSAVSEGSVQRRAKRSKYTSWNRSPFVESGASGSSSVLVLNGIINSGRGLKASIGDQFVKKGDKIGNNTVIDIKKDSVILSDGTKTIELKLKE